MNISILYKLSISKTYQASGDVFKEVTCDNGAYKLGNPVKDAGEDSDLAPNSQSKGDSWIYVATGNVGPHCHSHEEGKSMTNRYGH